MRFMIIVKATADTEAGILPSQELFDAMHDYNQELARAGVLLEANGLRPSRDGWRIRYHEGRRSHTDGPFAETKELIAGYTLIQVRSREEAVEWSRRFPAPHGMLADAEIEVRPLYELEDLRKLRPLDHATA
jgi:hypothetical protein